MIYRLAKFKRTGFEMTRMLASGADSAAALARSRTMEALVLNRSALSSARQGMGGGSNPSRTVTSHAWFSRHTSGNEDDLSARESLLEAGRGGFMASDLIFVSQAIARALWDYEPRSEC